MVSQSFSLESFEYFLLILTRVATFVFIAPFYSQRGVPNQVKIGVSALLSILVLFTIEPEEAEYISEIGFAVLVVKEALTGFLIGWAANICNYILMFAGNLIDMDIGISMATQFDPTYNTQVTITGNIYTQCVFMLLITSGMYRLILRTLIDTFSVIPLGGTVFRTDVLVEALTLYLVDVFLLGFRIMMPIFGAILVMNCVLGIMAKVAPQMNMFSVGIQIKVFCGLGILFVMVFLFPDVAEMLFSEMRLMMGNMLDGMRG